MLLIDNGTGAAPEQVAGAKKPAPTAAAGPVLLPDAFRKGQVELSVTVAPTSTDGRDLRVSFRNKGDALLRLSIPAGPTTLDVGTPLDKLRLQAAAAKTLEIAPGATSAAVDMTQTGTRRAVQGTFAVTVYEGQPLFSGNVTMGTVKP